MSADKKARRYADIQRRIAKRRPFGSGPQEEKPLKPADRVLDLLNAFDALAELAQRSYNSILCYGPKALHGPAWSGVVIWYHSRGYHGYQTLNLLGVWAHYQQGRITISIGIRKLPYRAPVYDPGVYRVAIQNNFRLYYEDDGLPPADRDRLLYRAPFELKKRLTHRQALSEILERWQRDIEAG
ncbi:MAG: hypothetical protein OXN88_13055 [Chloroflexota bacterium]|nr:hypothetical protein [Chloroflexota bacterium]